MRTKPIWYLSISELYPLSIPNTWWKTISIDFIIELPESVEFDIVMTVMDSISKTVHFVLTHTMVSAEEAAELFLHNI